MITLDHTKNDNIDIDLIITITDETHVLIFGKWDLDN